MCQPRPGPRCASHARQALEKAKAAELATRHAYEVGTADQVTMKKASLVRINAQLDYDSTPTGQNELASHIEITQSEAERQHLNARLTQANLHRRNMIQCSRLLQTAKAALKERQEELRKKEDDYKAAQVLLIEKDAELNRRVDSLEQSQKELQQVQQRIRQVYLKRGELEKASTPALWLYTADLDPAIRNRWLGLRRAVAQETEALAEAQRCRSQANAQMQISGLNFRMARAEVATGLSVNTTQHFENYGQVFINHDGSTNARMLTKIPYTDTEVFARVRTLMDDYAILETGTKVQLKSRRAPSYWRFEVPEADAVRGPQIFSMESSV